MRRKLLLSLSALTSAILVGAPMPRAQQGRTPRIGVLLLDDLERVQPLFRAALRDVGLIEGQNTQVEYRSAAGKVDRLDALATDLVRVKVDVIVGQTAPAVLAAKRATAVIPIVMAPAGDPVGSGLVASLARPGGNVTGVTGIGTDLGGKLVELIKEAKPTINDIAVLAHKDAAFRPAFLEQIRSAARRMGVEIREISVGATEELDGAFASMVKQRPGALIMVPILGTRRVADLALKHRLPSITSGLSLPAYPELGGLMSYGADPGEQYRRAAVYVGKILKGARPQDLPVEQPTKFELIVNLRTAHSIGLTIPQSILLRADRVIE